ncbi:hypothetical protein M427DRAFT_30972 [Gonapodya prolifera JEL478]|uniref:GST N-terminal domain-containing protein n=1 Tax=Gonapodya prolifera (strain JEL478) TaxID=1344416 RepID=A0A139AJA1_GONPJ|nr:hypothetical protein M427DRAFT_30972 [Gonapodya prolifera JEL478]|eukprot:KXS16871.1 hypothetical protein M427DRAFT_30972 [Gonapodya prolifera JEL478]
MPPIILHDVYTEHPKSTSAAPNPWLGRLCLVHKGVPFVVKLGTWRGLGDKSPGALWPRFAVTLGTGPGARPMLPTIEVPRIVDDTPYTDHPEPEPGLLVGDSITIAEYLDAHFPDKPSLFLPWHPVGTPPDTSSPQFAAAHAMARFVKEGLGNSDAQWASHFELAYEQHTAMYDEEDCEYLRSDYKMGFENAWDWLMSKDRAALLAHTRRSLLPLSAILSPQAPPRHSGGGTPPSLSRPPGTPLFLSSPTAPGLLDYIVFARWIMTYQVDEPLNKGIWSTTSDAARTWLRTYKDGKWALKGADAVPGAWFGDVQLPGVEDWVERMLDLHDGYTRKYFAGEKP